MAEATVFFQNTGDIMNKSIRILFPAALAVLALSACGPSEEDKQHAAAKAAEEAAMKSVPVPAADADKAAWKGYLVSVVRQNMHGVKSNSPYMYFVPGGDAQEAQDARQSQLDNVSGTAARGVLPGAMLAFGGPDSKLTADLVVGAFNSASDGSFKDVVVLFVGAAADQDRVKAALTKSGAEFRFVEMK
jgi:hypothetical protein